MGWRGLLFKPPEGASNLNTNTVSLVWRESADAEDLRHTLRCLADTCFLSLYITSLLHWLKEDWPDKPRWAGTLVSHVHGENDWDNRISTKTKISPNWEGPLESPLNMESIALAESDRQCSILCCLCMWGVTPSSRTCWWPVDPCILKQWLDWLDRNPQRSKVVLLLCRSKCICTAYIVKGKISVDTQMQICFRSHNLS